MFKLARLTDYAVVLLLSLSAFEDRRSAVDLSLSTGISLPTVRKILRHLSARGIVDSRRGIAGGYSLSAASDEINLASIFEAMEGPISLTACVDGATGRCHVEDFCSARGRWDIVNYAVKEALSSLTLADMREAESRFDGSGSGFRPGLASVSENLSEAKHGG